MFCKPNKARHQPTNNYEGPEVGMACFGAGIVNVHAMHK